MFSVFRPRCGSIIVDLALEFSSTVRESEVLFLLRVAANNGGFGDFNVSSITGTRSTGIATTPTSSPNSMLHKLSLTFRPLNLLFCFSDALANY